MIDATALYRHFDADDALLYVGISLSPFTRLTQHRSSSHWYRQIAKVTVEWFETRPDAEAAERQAIIRERPKHNKAHVVTDEVAALLDRLKGHPLVCYVTAHGMLSKDIPMMTEAECEEIADRLD